MKPTAESETSERQGHQEFEKIYQQFYPMVCAAAYSVLGSVDDAKDVAQNVFLRLAVRRFSPGEMRNLKGYLHRTATNHARSIIRWRGRQSIGDGVESMPDRCTAIKDDPFSGQVMKAVDRLKPQAAEMIVLRYAFDYTDEEIAQMLGKSRVVVAMTLSRARARVRKFIQQDARGGQ